MKYKVELSGGVVTEFDDSIEDRKKFTEKMDRMGYSVVAMEQLPERKDEGQQPTKSS